MTSKGPAGGYARAEGQAEAGATLVRLVHSQWAPATEEVRETYTHWADLLRRYAAHVS